MWWNYYRHIVKNNIFLESEVCFGRPQGAQLRYRKIVLRYLLWLIDIWVQTLWYRLWKTFWLLCDRFSFSWLCFLFFVDATQHSVEFISIQSFWTERKLKEYKMCKIQVGIVFLPVVVFLHVWMGESIFKDSFNLYMLVISGESFHLKDWKYVILSEAELKGKFFVLVLPTEKKSSL